VAIRVPSLSDGRDPLLVIVVLTLLLGLGVIGSALVNTEPLPRAAAEGPHPPARTVLPSTRTFPHAEADHFSSDLVSRSGHSLLPRPDIMGVASIDDDSREYLSKMAVLQRRRLTGRDRPADPYQVSLNPGVYLADVATPIARDAAP
jgi:hypothetical protein